MELKWKFALQIFTLPPLHLEILYYDYSEETIMFEFIDSLYW